MSGEGDSGGLVSSCELAQLAELFDNSENALDPLSTEAAEAEIEFERLALDLFKVRIQENDRFSRLSKNDFLAYLRLTGRRYLSKN